MAALLAHTGLASRRGITEVCLAVRIEVAPLDHRTRCGTRVRRTLARYSPRDGHGGRWRTRTSDLLLVGEDAPPPNPLSNQALTDAHATACTTACTSKPENGHETRPEGTGEAAPPSAAFDALAALIRQLSPEDRARLAVLLNTKDNGQ